MSSVVIAGDTSGSITLQAPAVAGSTVLTLPATSGTVLTSATGQTLTSPVINGMGSSILTSGTAVPSTSGTSIDFTGIPSWVKRITVMFNGVSTNGTSLVQVQIGSGSVLATGYLGSSSTTNNASASSVVNHSTGWTVEGDGAAAVIRHGSCVLSLINSSTNIWALSCFIGRSNTPASSGSGGTNTLSGALDRVRITTVNGTDTFDAGSINIMYE